MYGSGNVVIFVNLEDIFSEVEELLKSHPVYLCVSFDTDLIALENLTGFVSRWAEFTRSHEDLTIEIRTKSFRKDIYGKIAPCDRVIFAYTLSPPGDHREVREADRFPCRQAWCCRLRDGERIPRTPVLRPADLCAERERFIHIYV